MAKYVADHSMMGCSALGSTEGEVTYPEGVPCGILSGHAYSIIDAMCIEVKLVKKDENGDDTEETEMVHQKLVRCRNPWGKFLIY